MRHFATRFAPAMQNRPTADARVHEKAAKFRVITSTCASIEGWHIACKSLAPFPGRKADNREHIKETPMKLTRVIFLALAFIIPSMSTTVASAAEEAPAAAGDTEKPAKKKGKKAKKEKGEEKKADEAAK
jgi:hypothetical protein